VAVLGGGWSARRLTAALPPAATVVATVHRDPGTRSASFDGIPAMAYSTFAEFDEFDAAFVCTPPHTQVRLATELVQRGKHLVVEKPVGLDSAAVAGLVTEVARAGVVAHVPFHLMYVPALTEFLSARGRGEVGQSRHLTHRMFVSEQRRPAWLRSEFSGGPTIETMVHGFHLAYALCGSVSRGAVLHEGAHTAPEGGGAVLRHHSTALSVLEVSWRANGGTRRGGIELIADGAVLSVDRGTVEKPWVCARLRYGGGGRTWSHSDDLSFSLFVNDFVVRCLSAAPSCDLVDLESAMRALVIAEGAAYGGE
jgi:predicted dehydrogenase